MHGRNWAQGQYITLLKYGMWNLETVIWNSYALENDTDKPIINSFLEYFLNMGTVIPALMTLNTNQSIGVYVIF